MSATRLASGLLLVAVTAVGVPAGDSAAATIVGEYTPGITGASLGGAITVNGYGVAGIGAHRFALDDGSSALGMCIQANVSHSTSANYQRSDNALNNGALDYLTWRYLTGGGLSDVDAAGMAVAVWGLIGSQRRDGGVIVTPGNIVVNVAGVGRRTDVESAAARFIDEGLRRRGPWSLSDITVSDGAASVRLDGPAGAISGRPITFRLSAGSGAATWEATADTNDSGVATVDVAAAGPVDGRTLTASATGPGRSIELSAPGSQRFALAGTPIDLSATHEFPASPTTTTTSTTTTSTTTTTVPPTSTTSTTRPATTSTSTTTATSTTTSTSTSTTSPPSTPTSEPDTTAPPAVSTSEPDTTPPASTSEPPDITSTPSTDGPPESLVTVPPDEPPRAAEPPPDIAVTGGSARTVVRAGAALFAIGSLISLASAGRRVQPRREERSG